MASSCIVGIDLGTTYSAVAVFREGGVERIPNALGETLTPSVVAFDPHSGSVWVGRPAKDRYALDATCGVAAFKRGMGTDLDYPLGGARYGAVDLSALILRALKEDAERALGEPVERAVITVPAYFDEAQRYATMKAGDLAGLEVVRILNEPTAAAIAHGLHQRHSDGTMVVFDLGGGTFDVCVMDRFEGLLEVRSVAGESRLGGEDFTRALAALAVARAGASFEQAELRDPAGLGLLLKRAELAKRALSRQPEVTVRVPVLRGALADETEVRVPVADALAAWAPLLERLAGPCRAALRGAERTRDQVDELLLVGGATRMPAVADFARQFFGRDPLASVDPDYAVVHGAAIQAAMCAEDRSVQDLIVTDIASHSLGTEVTKDFGATEVDGFFAPIIHRNTVIPVSRSDIFATRYPNQTSVHFGIYEGESRYVKDNRKIGDLVVRNIPRGPRGQKVRITFTFDLNGLLEVEAEVLATGERVAKVFHRETGALAADQVEAARKRLQRLKRDPRENAQVREAIARAELLLKEVDPLQRRRIEEALDALEDALARREPDAIQGALLDLKGRCESVDEGERW